VDIEIPYETDDVRLVVNMEYETHFEGLFWTSGQTYVRWHSFQRWAKEREEVRVPTRPHASPPDLSREHFTAVVNYVRKHEDIFFDTRMPNWDLSTPTWYRQPEVWSLRFLTTTVPGTELIGCSEWYDEVTTMSNRLREFRLACIERYGGRAVCLGTEVFRRLPGNVFYVYLGHSFGDRRIFLHTVDRTILNELGRSHEVFKFFNLLDAVLCFRTGLNRSAGSLICPTGAPVYYGIHLTRVGFEPLGEGYVTDSLSVVNDEIYSGAVKDLRVEVIEDSSFENAHHFRLHGYAAPGVTYSDVSRSLNTCHYRLPRNGVEFRHWDSGLGNSHILWRKLKVVELAEKVTTVRGEKSTTETLLHGARCKHDAVDDTWWVRVVDGYVMSDVEKENQYRVLPGIAYP
jgi:hypothetical protein